MIFSPAREGFLEILGSVDLMEACRERAPLRQRQLPSYHFSQFSLDQSREKYRAERPIQRKNLLLVSKTQQ
jgi:hypothetical protein